MIKFHDFNYKTLTGTTKVYFQCLPFHPDKAVLFDMITCELHVIDFTGLRIYGLPYLAGIFFKKNN
jgi:hypothetical protein